MSRRNFRTYTLQLVANQEFKIDVEGNMYAVIQSESIFTITLDESNRLAAQVSGMGGEFPRDYQRATLLSPVAQTVIVIFGFGKFNDARASVNANINTNIAGSDIVNNPGDVIAGDAATLAIAANANRKEVELCLPSSAENPVRVGSATVTANSGSIIEPGTSKIFAVEAALYVIRTAAPDETVTVLELERS